MARNAVFDRASILRAIFIGIASCLVGAQPVFAKDASEDETRAAMRSLPWQAGPLTAPVGDKASMDVPKGDGLLAQGKTDKFFQLTGNLPMPGSTVLVSDGWWAVFSFNDSGYIKDDEKLDPDALLKSLKDRDAEENEERTKRGLPKIYTDGWIVPPHYDAQTKHLEWGVTLHSDDQPQPVVNYTVRLLGRSGYESVVLVTDPAGMNAAIAELRTTLGNFNFNQGEKYDQFKEGDRVAEYGLGALVVGGAAAVAVKTGLWKVIVAALAAGWKFVLAGVAAVGAAISKFLKRKTA